METYSYEKKPAFFRCLCAYMFFEAEASSDEIVENLNSTLSLDADPELDAELDEILGLQEVR